ncbi:hypothetical protein Bbelb_434130 [Branchiostoma belcheri]|nr:hypothetical protein Bbelb_434130 [Branchiostoma belcheri]
MYIPYPTTYPTAEQRTLLQNNVPYYRTTYPTAEQRTLLQNNVPYYRTTYPTAEQRTLLQNNVPYCRTTYRQMTTFPRKVTDWHSLLSGIVDAPSLESFPDRLAQQA